MHLSTLVVIVVAGFATLWLGYYVLVVLPRREEEQYREIIQAFCTAIELRFPSHRGHSMRAAALGRAVGGRLGLSRRRLVDLEMAAYLRDIGLCAVPYGFVNSRRPEQWTSAERYTYERHGEISGAMLELVPHLSHLAVIVRNHHVDYRSGERVSEVLRSRLPLEAYILNAVTSFLWTERHADGFLAREELREGSGSTFHPDVVAVLLDVLPSVRAGEPSSVEAI